MFIFYFINHSTSRFFRCSSATTWPDNLRVVILQITSNMISGKTTQMQNAFNSHWSITGFNVLPISFSGLSVIVDSRSLSGYGMCRDAQLEITLPEARLFFATLLLMH